MLFFSRVCKEKGVEIAIEAHRILQKKHHIIFDIYGPIEKNYKETFAKLLKNTTNVNYKGILAPNNYETYNIIENYDFMVFPTIFKNEGFAGSIIDSYIAGVPIIASFWENGRGLIKEEETGYYFTMGDIKDLADKIELFINTRSNWGQLRAKCISEAQKYEISTLFADNGIDFR